MSDRVTADHWSTTDLRNLGRGVGPDGRKLPTQGYVALRRLGWTATPPVGVYVPERACRIAEEEAARTLRLAVVRLDVLDAVIRTWPVDPSQRTSAEWAALRALLPRLGRQRDDPEPGQPGGRVPRAAGGESKASIVQPRKAEGNALRWSPVNLPLLNQSFAMDDAVPRRRRAIPADPIPAGHPHLRWTRGAIRGVAPLWPALAAPYGYR
jgi:hypothetical protein